MELIVLLMAFTVYETLIKLNTLHLHVISLIFARSIYIKNDTIFLWFVLAIS